ncbi:MAG: HEAT repeat domain-containing protein, partial [Planctomycetota bacterium]
MPIGNGNMKSAVVFILSILCILVGIASARAAETPGQIDGAFEKLKAYDHTQPRAPLALIESYVARSMKDRSSMRRAARRLAGVLAAPGATGAAKVFACKQLAFVGSEAEVPLLVRMLGKAETAEMARRALEGIPGGASLSALRSSLSRLKGRELVGAVNSLGIRRDARATGELAGLLGGRDRKAAGAAARALGKIGSPEAARALSSPGLPPGLAEAIHDARLVCAKRLLAAGNAGAAASIYRSMWASHGPWAWRIAGLSGLVKVSGEKALPILLEALASDSPTVQTAALGLIRELPGREATEALARRLSDLNPKRQALVLDVLAERGDRAAAPAVAKLIGSADELVRAAAIRAIGKLGDASSVEVLARLAATGGRAVRGAARESLARLSGPGVEERILALASNRARGEPALRVELIGAVAARRSEGATRVLLAAATDADAKVRRAAFDALALVGGAESYPKLVRMLLVPRSASEARALEKAAVAVGGRLGAGRQRLDPVLAALGAAAAESKPSLLRVLGGCGGPEALSRVRASLGDVDESVRDAAVRVLASWPDASAAGELLKLARESGSVTHRTLALRGYLRLARASSGRARLKMLDDVRPVATTAAAKRMLLACLGDVHDAGALSAASSYLDDREVRAEAAMAMLKIAGEILRTDRQAVREGMDTLIKKTSDPKVRRDAEALRSRAERPPRPVSQQEALAYNKGRSEATKRKLSARAPAGFHLVCYLDCGPDRSDGGKGGPGLRLVSGQTHFWPGSDSRADVRFGTVFYDGTTVIFEATGLSPRKSYRLGFSWWDYDHNDRAASVWVTPARSNRRTTLLGTTKLPSATRSEKPGEHTLAIPRKLSASGALKVGFSGGGGANVVVSELWLWESDAEGAAPAGRPTTSIREPAAPVREAASIKRGKSRGTRVIIVTGVDYPGHKWRQTSPVLRDGLEEDARLGVDVVEDPAFLASPKLRDYDVIVLHFMDWKVPAPGEEARANLKRLVEGGKGLVIVHFACGAFQDWPEFRSLAGRVWDPKKRGHDPRGRFRVDITDVDHPITRGLESF